MDRRRQSTEGKRAGKKRNGNVKKIKILASQTCNVEREGWVETGRLPFAAQRKGGQRPQAHLVATKFKAQCHIGEGLRVTILWLENSDSDSLKTKYVCVFIIDTLCSCVYIDFFAGCWRYNGGR